MSNKYLNLTGLQKFKEKISVIATQEKDGFMSSTDKTKLDGIATGANKYTHPSYTAKSSGLYKVTVDDTGHVSAVTAVAKSDITGLGIPAQDTTYSNFVKSGSGAKAGLVPAPSTTAGTTKYLREDGTWATPTDTKNTAGSTNSSSKLFLIGATSQATNPQTYSHDTAYVGTDGCLYSNSTKVSVEGHSHSYLPLSGGTVTGATNFTGQVIFDYMMRTKGGYSLLYNGNYVQAFYISTNTIKPSSIDQEQLVFGAAASNTGLATVIRGSTIWLNSNFLYQKTTMSYYTSDARLKTDEGYLDKSNEKTSKYISLWEKMIPRAFRMKEDVENIGDEAKYQLGYYAQEFQESLHDCNLTEKDFAGLSIVKDYVDDSEDQDDTEFLDNRYFLSYDQCSMLTDIKLRQVVNEVLPTMQTTIDSLKAQVEELTNIISEMKGE